MFLKTLSSQLSSPIRLTPEVYKLITELADTTKFSKAQYVIEQSIALYARFQSDIDRGCKFVEIATEGVQYAVEFELGEVTSNEVATERHRVSNSIIEMIKALTPKGTVEDAIPTLHSALNLSLMIDNSLENGSEFIVIEPNGEKYKIAFV